MRTRRYEDGGKTQANIDKLQALIDNPKTSADDRKNFKEILKKYQDKLASETTATAKPKPTATAKPVAKPVVRKPTATAKPVAKPVVKKPTATAKPVAKPVVKKPTTTAKPVAKKPTTTAKPKPTAKPVAKKLPRGVQMVSKKKVIIDGKELSTDSKEFCDYLTAEFIKRKEQANKNKGTRKKTKSVMEQVSNNIEKGVQKAIKTGIAKQIPTLKKNPKVFIGKVQKLETATKNFLTQLKEVLGNDYDAKEVTDSVNAIHKLIEDLKKKYAKK
jgi:hypothetical protein